MDNGAGRHSKPKSPVAGLIPFIYFHEPLLLRVRRAGIGSRSQSVATRWVVLIGLALSTPKLSPVVWRDRRDPERRFLIKIGINPRVFNSCCVCSSASPKSLSLLFLFSSRSYFALHIVIWLNCVFLFLCFSFALNPSSLNSAGLSDSVFEQDGHQGFRPRSIYSRNDDGNKYNGADQIFLSFFFLF